MQGLYGTFSFSELLLQKIWWRGDFERERTVTTEGVPVRVVHAGKWNRLGGPDFRVARVVLADGRKVTGDVELHLHAADWNANGHANDPAYDGVCLHVVFFRRRRDNAHAGPEGGRFPCCRCCLCCDTISKSTRRMRRSSVWRLGPRDELLKNLGR